MKSHAKTREVLRVLEFEWPKVSSFISVIVHVAQAVQLARADRFALLSGGEENSDIAHIRSGRTRRNYVAQRHEKSISIAALQEVVRVQAN